MLPGLNSSNIDLDGQQWYYLKVYVNISILNYHSYMHCNRCLFITCLLVVLTTFTCVQAQVRSRINLDEGWKFHLGDAAAATKDFNYTIENIFSKTGSTGYTAINPDFEDSAWQTVQLPHDWAVQLPFVYSADANVMSHGYKPIGGLFPQNNIGWYRKHFRIPAADSLHRFTIQFDGIFREANIWINGLYAGNNKSGYAGVSFDITDYLNFNTDNVIVVRADASQYEGWSYEGAGIYRHVWLTETGNIHLAENGVYVYTYLHNNTAIVNIETTINNNESTLVNCNVFTYVTNRNGQQIGEVNIAPVSVYPQKNKYIKQQVLITQPVCWSPDTPYLYRVVSLVKSGTQLLDSCSQRVGIRTINVNEKGIYLNDKYIKIKGVNCHQDHAGVGTAMPDFLQYYRIKLLKEAGVNAYRTSHNEAAPELLDACDSLGILVLEEQRLQNSSPEYTDQFKRMLLRDRNRPSVFMWAVGNEESYVQRNSHNKRIVQSLINIQKDLDPSRTCTYASAIDTVYTGINEVIPVRGFNYRLKDIQPYRAAHPKQPVIGAEMGGTVGTRGIYVQDSVNAYVPDEDITAPSQKNRAEEWWSLCAKIKWWPGGFVWAGFDYRGEPTPFTWPGINSNSGIMDMCGFPKNIYYYYQSWWTGKDVLHISPHWNWKGKEGQPIDVWVNTNADNVELFLNKKSLGKKSMPVNGHLQWNVVYEPGVLEAVANKKGKKLTARVQTTGAPYKLVLLPDKTQLAADGKDGTVINVTVLDKQGLEVPDASNFIHFNVAGASIIGVGNGNPNSHEPDQCEPGNWQRKLFNGKCQLIVQAGKLQKAITVIASSPQLIAATANLSTSGFVQ